MEFGQAGQPGPQIAVRQVRVRQRLHPHLNTGGRRAGQPDPLAQHLDPRRAGGQRRARLEPATPFVIATAARETGGRGRAPVVGHGELPGQPLTHHATAWTARPQAAHPASADQPTTMRPRRALPRRPRSRAHRRVQDGDLVAQHDVAEEKLAPRLLDQPVARHRPQRAQGRRRRGVLGRPPRPDVTDMSGLTAPVRESQPVIVHDGLGHPGRQGSHRHQGVRGGAER